MITATQGLRIANWLADQPDLTQVQNDIADLLAEYMNAPVQVENYLTNPKGCPHTWQPLSFRFETQLLDPEGRVIVRQPDTNEAKVYMVCMRCAQWTYITTSFCGWQQYGSAHRQELREQDTDTEQETP